MTGDWSRYLAAGETLLEQHFVPTATTSGVVISTIGREGGDPVIELRRFTRHDHGDLTPDAAAWRVPVASALWISDVLHSVVRNALAREPRWAEEVTDRDVVLAGGVAPASVGGTQFVTAEAVLQCGTGAGETLVTAQRWQHTDGGAPFPDGEGITAKPMRILSLVRALKRCFFVGFDATPIEPHPPTAPPDADA